MRTLLDEPDFMKLPQSTEDFGNLILPENFDSKEQWQNYESIKEVRDQSSCDSCWAFGAAEAMSDRLYFVLGSQTRIQTEDLLTCQGLSLKMECNGGYPSDGWSYFKIKGLVSVQPQTFLPSDHHVDVRKYGPYGDSKPTPSCIKSYTKESGRVYDTNKIRSCLFIFCLSKSRINHE